MCGILGLMNLGAIGAVGGGRRFRRRFERLLRVSESRGREAAGVVWATDSEVVTYKEPRTASRMMESAPYKQAWRELDVEGSLHGVLGHSRLATNGSESNNANNQPISGYGFTLLHNGIVTNGDALWDIAGSRPSTELDTEVIPALLHRLGGGGALDQVEIALSEIGRLVDGTVSIAFVHQAHHMVYLYSNNESLYWCYLDSGRQLAFASESRILREALGVAQADVMQVAARDMVAVDYVSGAVHAKTPMPDIPPAGRSSMCQRRLREIEAPLNLATPAPMILVDPHVYRGWSGLEIQWDRIDRMRRCSVGTLPETMPYITFDSAQVSNYTKNHVPYRPKGEKELNRLIEGNRHPQGKRCLVAFSGGRDSSFALHYLKMAGMKPVAFTYDWGMVTDLARRNQARLCGKLGVEHIIVSADIRTKRDNIRRNVLAWLKRPHLGTVPLFMAGDKQYFYHANRLRKALDVNWVVLAANPMERTNFKSGFAGVPPSFANRPRFVDKARLLGFYLQQFFANTAYLNRSLVDTAAAYLSFYAIPHDHLRLFDYLRWNEALIDDRLLEMFDWERATDTKTTWRIGDGTAAFYNYIFMQVAGFTENDSLRHNQVLQGDLGRLDALELIRRDNMPRFDSIEWYCRAIGIDPIETLKQIVKIPKLYGR